MKKCLIYMLFIFVSLIACNEKPLEVNNTVKNEAAKKIESDTVVEKTKPLPEKIDRDTVK